MCDHSHSSASEPLQDKDIETLRILLAHWIEHNKSHEENFRQWAHKSEKLGKAKVSEMISKAADSLNAASSFLLEAKKYI
ncbi:MAG TPA: hypothetical protein GXX35_01555 [Thermoanaerobacterales bacterium]|nr:hypothetical protein [Thermoanaerobacterales bacterium]